ncbi:hypothetical protein WG904_03485 [Pedobacter sp. Du54]|uniref:hypothetical protein n=1 Tax=Pedobacter anseongensis TaxID=3133439 RepID=UPI0030AE47C0
MDLKAAINRGNLKNELQQDCERLLRNIISPYFLSSKFWEWYSTNDPKPSVFKYLSRHLNDDYDVLRNQLTDKFSDLFQFAPEASTIQFLKYLIALAEAESVVKELNRSKLFFDTDYLEIFKELTCQHKNDISHEQLSRFIDGYISNRILESLPALIEVLKAFVVELQRSIPVLPKLPIKKYNANERALAYIFDLYANNERIPINIVEGSFDKKAILEVGKKKGFEAPDTFYRAVKQMSNLTDKKEFIQSVSKRWIEAVEKLSIDWPKTKRYLITKGLIGEQ